MGKATVAEGRRPHLSSAAVLLAIAGCTACAPTSTPQAAAAVSATPSPAAGVRDPSTAAPDVTEKDAAAPPPVSWVKTSHAADCTFAGSLRPGPSLLFAGPNERDPLARLDDSTVLEVERLELPSKSERYKVALSGPVVAILWLDAHARPFALPTRVDVVPGHVWLDAGAPLGAQRIDGTHASLLAALEPVGPSIPSVPELKPLSVVEPRVEVRNPPVPPAVACNDIDLGGAPRPAASMGAGSTERSANTESSTALPEDRGVPLFDQANAEHEVARVHGPGAVARKGQSGAWTEIAYDGYRISFDGWARTSDLAPAGAGAFGWIGLVRATGLPTRTVRAREPVRLRPDPAAPVVFSLAPNTTVDVLGMAARDFERIAISGLFSPDDQTEYFILRPALGEGVH